MKIYYEIKFGEVVSDYWGAQYSHAYILVDKSTDKSLTTWFRGQFGK